jgi:hypothetical protein
MLEHHPHRTLTHLVGIPPDTLSLWHSSILSRPGAVTEPGAVQSGDDRHLGTVLGRVHPFLAFPVELRTIVYTTNAIESLNARFRKAVRHRGHFPNEQAALKVLYLVATQRRPNRSGGSTPGSPS